MIDFNISFWDRLPPARLSPPPPLMPLSIHPGDERVVLVTRPGEMVGSLARYHYDRERWEVCTLPKNDLWANAYASRRWVPLDEVTLPGGSGRFGWLEIRAGQIAVDDL